MPYPVSACRGRSFGAASASPLLTSLLAYYKLGDVNDSHTNGYNLTNTNTVTFVAGKVGNAANFVAASSQKLSYASNVMNADADFSVAWWMNPVAGVTGDCFFVGTTNLFDGFRVFWDQANKRLSINRAGVGTLCNSGGNSVIGGTYYHCCVTYVGSSGLITIYVNGSAAGTTANNTTSVGTKGYSFGFCGSNAYSGTCDELGIWSRVLTGAEITQLYNGGSGCTYPTF